MDFANFRPLSDDEMRVHTPVVISCNENRREVCAVQNIANKQIDRTFAFDKVWLCLILFISFGMCSRGVQDFEFFKVLCVSFCC